MWTHMPSSGLIPFIATSICLMILLAAELLNFFCSGISEYLYKLIPKKFTLSNKFNKDDNIDKKTRDNKFGSKALEFIYFDCIPTSTLIILFVSCFTVIGFIMQYLSITFWGHYVSSWSISFIAFVISLPMLKLLTTLLHPILSINQTKKHSEESLVGQPAKILIGYASIGRPAQAQTINADGKTLYIMIEPDPSYFNDPRNHDHSIKGLSYLHTNTPHQPISAHSEHMMPYDTATVNDNDKLVITQKKGCRYLVRKV